ncbi:phage tail assembly chaperone [Paenibacillus sinopodophylli]|uniref:phage tail assembly chaperone n=1 Tax=Paenibacillus sinopodophylli TaxID=1837342 RepID=UPI00110CC413|nr:XkdN-like protein [Paenibacillus sinopodophylli]
MSLQDFLNQNVVDGVTDEVAISDRFKDNEGNLYKFKIKAMSGDDFNSIQKRSTTVGKRNKVDFDSRRFNAAVIIENTIVPDFKDAESIKKLGVATPEQYLNKVLLAGEQAELSIQIQRLSGFDKDMNDLVEEAKN